MNLVNPYLFSTLKRGLVAYYPLDGNANDALGLHNGVVDGSVSFVSGKNNQAASFVSLASIKAVNSFDFSFTNGVNDVPFSISAWINFDSLTGVQFIVSKWQTVGSNEWLCAWNSTFLTIVTAIPGSSSLIRANYTFVPVLNKWYHLVFSYNGSGLSSGFDIYVNGVKVSADKAGSYTGMQSTGTVLRLGNSAVDEYFKGRIDEVAIWKNRKLVDSEVLELYRSGVGKFYPF